jgi:hypothetical protein
MDRLADTLGALRVDVVDEIDVWQKEPQRQRQQRPAASSSTSPDTVVDQRACPELSTQLLHAFAGFFGEHKAGHECGVPLGRAFATERRSRQTDVHV